MEMQGWFTEDAARRAVAIGGHDLDQLRQAAERRDFQPVPLGIRMSIALKCTVREKDTANVLGLLPGCDEELGKEMVVYMAHHDHIGMAAQRDQRGDNICNGAVDNASGVAALLAIAAAYGRLPERPARSVLFAAVGAEEQGLLGSAYLAEHPPVPAGFLAALLNIDGINILGPTYDVNVIGYGKSTMDQIVQRIATWQKRVVTPDHFPDRGYYYRSDQFSLARIGVPGVYLHSGIHVIGKPEGWGREQLEKWVETNYHQPSDEYSDTWDLSGAVSDVRLLFYSGLQAATQRELPQWAAGDEFERARQTALEARAN
jgi:Zn-dependent M28 family amino/carboxypeptidase